MALKRHKHHIGPRYIEVYRASGEDFLGVAGGATGEAAAFLSRGAQVIVRMRGLPYDATPQQVLDFFASGEDPVAVVDGAEGVLFVRRADGRATGDAFVLFAHEADAPRALARHRRLIGARYIELFRSTIAEVQQVLNRSLERGGGASGAGGGAAGGAAGGAGSVAAEVVPVMLPQHVITSGTAKDCVRLRGLPYEAKVEHILTFLDEFAKNIVVQGVHMVYNSQGHPSGEAFIQMDSETSAFLCAQQKHHRYMTFGKKQRYIEVFQCSGDDMSLVLTGGTGGAAPGAVAAPKVLSPGMCQPRLLAHSIAQHNLLARQHESLLLSLRAPYLPVPVRAPSPYLPAMQPALPAPALPAKRTYERAFAGAEAPPAKRPYPVAAPLQLPMPVFSYASPMFTSSSPAFSYGMQAGLPPLPGYAPVSSPFPPHLSVFPAYPYYPGV